jgi:DNA-binding CsgD family transcriptional regulator
MRNGLKPTAGAKAFDLTRLELIALTLVANGLATADIASRLPAAEADIEAALLEAERKLGANNRLHAVAIAVQRGLIGIEVKG